MMFHTMELIPGKTPFVRNRLMQRLMLRRIEGVIRYFEELSKS
jgi:hypothetical protein